MPRYAEGTSVSVDKSRFEIESVLRRYGADGFRYGWRDRDGKRVEQIEFSARERHIRFTLPMPSKDDKRFSTTPAGRRWRSDQARLQAWEQACRQAWRALALCIKAKLEAVECKISEFESEFLAHIVNPDSGMTIGEHVLPLLRDNAPLGLPAPAEVVPQDGEIVGP